MNKEKQATKFQEKREGNPNQRREASSLLKKAFVASFSLKYLVGEEFLFGFPYLFAVDSGVVGESASPVIND